MRLITKTVCPFCRQCKASIRGDGCCYCDHTGLIDIGEGAPFANVLEADSHDPEISLYDLADNRRNGRPNNYKPF